MNEENKKQIDDYCDNAARIIAKAEILQKDAEDYTGKIEKDLLDLMSSWRRIVDLKINNYDRFIDLETFLLKLFIPIFSISFAVGVNIFGIGIHTLKLLSFDIIFFDIIFLIVTLFFRRKIVASEEKRYELDRSLFKIKMEKIADEMLTRSKQLRDEGINMEKIAEKISSQ